MRAVEWLRAAALAVCVGLASCGGGGGGDSNSSNLQVSADKSSLKFFGFVGTPMPAQSIHFSLLNGTGGTYYGRVVSDHGNDFQVAFDPTSSTTGVVTMTPIGATAGTQSGTLTFQLCTDNQCAHVAWSKAIPYTRTAFAIDASGITASSFEGAVSPPQRIAVDPPDTKHQLQVRASDSSTTAPAWMQATMDAGGSIELVLTAAGIAAGNYQGTVTVDYAGVDGSQALQIPVSFAIDTALILPPARTIELRADSTSATLSGQVPITFHGQQSPAWSAVSDQRWLLVTKTAAPGDGTLSYRIDTDHLDGVPDGSKATATVSITAGGVSTPASYSVTVDKHLAEVYTISPASIYIGQPTTLTVSGIGFSHLPAAGLTVDGVTGATTKVTSDTEAVVSVPALAKGRFGVSAPNALGLSTATSAFTVAGFPPPVYATAANAGEKLSSVFDETRTAVFAVNLTQNTLVRYRLVNGSWETSGLPVASIGDMALSPDRQTLYVASGTSKLLAVDPDTLQVRTTFTAPASSPSLAYSRGRTRGFAITNNARLWFGESQWSAMSYFDFAHSTFGTLPLQAPLYGPTFSSSADGSVMFVAQSVLSPPQPNYLYRPAKGEMLDASAGVPVVYEDAVFSADGAKVLIDSETLYDTAAFTLIGSAQVDVPGFGTKAVLSADGRRIYRLVTVSTSSLTIDHIDVFDATSVQTASSKLVKLGEIPMAVQALDCGASPAYGCDVLGSLTISPLGNALFWVGNERLVVIPIPPALSAVQSAGPAWVKALR